MALSKKHFEAIVAQFAAAQRRSLELRGEGHTYSLIALEELASCLAAVFASENPNFNRARFLRACGF